MGQPIDLLELRLHGTRHTVSFRAQGGSIALTEGGWRFNGPLDLIETGNVIDPAVRPDHLSFFFHGDCALTLRSSVGGDPLPPGSSYSLRLYDLSDRLIGEHIFPLKGRTATLPAPGAPGRGCIVLHLEGEGLVPPLRLRIERVDTAEAATAGLAAALPPALADQIAAEWSEGDAG